MAKRLKAFKSSSLTPIEGLPRRRKFYMRRENHNKETEMKDRRLCCWKILAHEQIPRTIYFGPSLDASKWPNQRERLSMKREVKQEALQEKGWHMTRNEKSNMKKAMSILTRRVTRRATRFWPRNKAHFFWKPKSISNKINSKSTIPKISNLPGGK
mgnify:CR=1 FL=1